MTRTLIAYTLIIIILITLLSAMVYFKNYTPIVPFDIDKAKVFLEKQYIEELGLLRASCCCSADVYRVYIASDNLLAMRALAILGSKLSQNVSKTLSKYGGGFDNLHEVLLGYEIGDLFYCRYYENLGYIHLGSYNIFELLYEKPNRTCIITDWNKYADLLVYKALNEIIRKHNIRYAEKLMDELMKLWDGFGFKDKAFKGSYESYKIALAVYLWRTIRKYNPTYTKYAEIILKIDSIAYILQDKNLGGFYTHYSVIDGKIVPYGDVNVETTSVFIISYLQ